MITTNSIWTFLGLLALAAAGAVARIWIKSYVEKSAQAIVDRDLEGFKSELRQQEASLNGLQSSILSGRASRAALIDKKNLDAIDAVWKDVIRLRGAGMAVLMMQILKIPEINKKAARDPKMREFLEIARGTLGIKDIGNVDVDGHQPFVGPVLWSKFSALRAVYSYAVVIIDSMAKGIEDIENLVSDMSKLNEMLTEALPHQSKYIADHPKVAAFHLTTQLSDAVLRAIKDEIDGVQSDANAVKRAHHIMTLASDLERSQHGKSMAAK